jgi:glycosyltransferase involved in cell wall biosynthesis
MNKLSVTIITYNESENIGRCLDSVQWADEILVVDSYSTDNTIEIAKSKGAKIVSTDWLGFGKTKKFAVNNTANDWVFSLDADEEVTEDLSKKIKEILLNPKCDGYSIKRKSFYLGKMINYCGWDKDFPLRLFNKTKGNFNEKEVHESVQINGKKGRIYEPMLHYTYPDIDTHFIKMNRYGELASKKLVEKGKFYNPLVSLLFAINKFMKMYFLKLGFLDGINGLILCINSAIGIYIKYIKTWQFKK